MTHNAKSEMSVFLGSPNLQVLFVCDRIHVEAEEVKRPENIYCMCLCWHHAVSFHYDRHGNGLYIYVLCSLAPSKINAIF